MNDKCISVANHIIEEYEYMNAHKRNEHVPQIYLSVRRLQAIMFICDMLYMQENGVSLYMHKNDAVESDFMDADLESDSLYHLGYRGPYIPEIYDLFVDAGGTEVGGPQCPWKLFGYYPEMYKMHDTVQEKFISGIISLLEAKSTKELIELCYYSFAPWSYYYRLYGDKKGITLKSEEAFEFFKKGNIVVF